MFILTLALFLMVGQPQANAAQAVYMTDRLVVTSAQTGAEHNFNVELALTPGQQKRGLMFRTHLDADSGMLFWFGPQEEERSFWMKNTLIPLDIVFIKQDGTIHHIHENAQPGDVTTGILSNGPVSAVLEINAGRAAELGLKPGDKVEQRFFSN